MVKKTCNILIIILLAASVDVYAADYTPAILTNPSNYSVLRDTAKPKDHPKNPKEKKMRAGSRKVTFESFDQNYERAMRFYNNKQYLSAAGLFEELYPLSLGTPRADTILYLFASSYYLNEDYTMAAFHFRDYVRRYPNSERTEDAFYYCVRSIYETSPDYSLDQSNTDYAIEQIKAFIQAYPNDNHIAECNTMLDQLRLKLARKDLEVLKLYYNTDHFEACQIAAKNFFNDYSYSPLMPDAIYYLILNNYEFARKSVDRKKQERYKACVEACEKMKTDYSDSKYVKEIDKIERDSNKQLEKYNNQK